MDSKSTLKISPLSFLISPVISFVVACRNLSSWLNGLTFALFYGFFGYAHSFADPRPDGYRKMIAFTHFPSSITYSDIFQDYVDGIVPDIVQGFLYVFVRSFSTNANVLLLTVGIIGGFVLYLSFRKIIYYCGTDKGIGFYTLIFILVILHSPPVLGGIRFFIGFPLFLYGTLLFLIEKRNIGIVWLLLSPLSHFSFVVAVPLVLALRLFKFNITILWWCTVFFCVISMFVNGASFSQLFSSVDLGEYNTVVSGKAAFYSSTNVIEHFNESLTTHLLRLQQYITRIYVLIVLFIIKHKRLNLRMSEFDINFYRITLAFLSFGFLFISFSVVGERYLLTGLYLFFVLMYRLCYRYQCGHLISLFRYSIIFFVFNIGWVFYNSYVDLNLLYLVLPLPLFMAS